MRKSISKLLAENKWLKKQVNELEKDIHTLLTKPDGYEAMEIKAGRQMSQQAIDGIMAGSYGKGINLKPLDKDAIDLFVERWKKEPIKPIELTSSFLKIMDSDSTKTYLDDFAKVACEKCHIKKELDDSKLHIVPYHYANVPYTHDLMVEFELKVEEYLSSNQLSEKERDFFLELPNSRKQMVLDNVITLGTLMHMIGIPDSHFTTVKSGDCNIHVRKHPFWNGLFNNIKHDHT